VRGTTPTPYVSDAPSAAYEPGSGGAREGSVGGGRVEVRAGRDACEEPQAVTSTRTATRTREVRDRCGKEWTYGEAVEKGGRHDRLSIP
jgi:hypothetical protein